MITIVKYYINTIQRKFVGIQKILKFKIFIENIKESNKFFEKSTLFFITEPSKIF